MRVRVGGLGFGCGCVRLVYFGMKQEPTEDHVKLCGEYSRLLIEPLREVAKSHGYAMGVHGSLRRDIDLIAVPWVAQTSTPKVLAYAIRSKCEELVGTAFQHALERSEFFMTGCPGGKPHGRLCWSFHLGGGPYIDLSVVPPVDCPDGLERCEHGVVKGNYWCEGCKGVAKPRP